MNTPIWLKPLHLQLVFAGRNQSYGAFDLRSRYEKNMARAMAFGFLFFIGAFGGMLYLTLHKSLGLEAAITEIPKIVEMSTFRKPEVVVIPKMEVPKNIPLQSQIKYVAPQVVYDDFEQPTTDLPTQDNLTNVDIGLTDHISEDPGTISQSITEQTGTAIEAAVDEEPVAIYAVQQQPEFPGGEKAMYEYLASHLKFPELARSNGISGTVVVRFVVSASGAIENVIIVKSPSTLFDKMSKQVIESMPTWKPGIMNGKAVSVYFTLPLKFQLQ